MVAGVLNEVAVSDVNLLTEIGVVAGASCS